MLPSVYYNMPLGERLILKAFFERKIEDDIKERKNLGEAPIFPVKVLNN